MVLNYKIWELTVLSCSTLSEDEFRKRHPPKRLLTCVWLPMMLLMVVVLMVTRVESLLLHMQMSKHVWRLDVKKVHILPLRLFLFLSPFFVFAINTVCYKQKQNKEAKIVIWTIHCPVLHYNNEYWRLSSCVFSLTHSETVLSLMSNN